MNIVFVCEGNMMRSQMAEAFYNHITSSSDATSAGAAATLADRVPSSIAEAMSEKDISMDGMSSTQVTPEIVDAADIVVAFPTPYMPDYLLHNPKTIHWDVADPFYQPEDGTDYVRLVRDDIERRVQELLSAGEQPSVG